MRKEILERIKEVTRDNNLSLIFTPNYRGDIILEIRDKDGELIENLGEISTL